MSLEIPIMPLNAVLFPGMPMPLLIFEDRYIRMLKHCLADDSVFGIVKIKEGDEVGGTAVPCDVGTTASIVGVAEPEESGIEILTVGRQRFRLEAIVSQDPYLVGKVSIIEDIAEPAPAPLVEDIRLLLQKHLQLVLSLLDQPVAELSIPDNATGLSYMVAAHLMSPNTVRQELLETDHVYLRLERERELLKREIKENSAILASRRLLELINTDEDSDDEEMVFSLN